MTKYVVISFETNRYEGGFAIKNIDDPGAEFAATIDGQSEACREQMQKLADKLNAQIAEIEKERWGAADARKAKK